MNETIRSTVPMPDRSMRKSFATTTPMRPAPITQSGRSARRVASTIEATASRVHWAGLPFALEPMLSSRLVQRPQQGSVYPDECAGAGGGDQPGARRAQPRRETVLARGAQPHRDQDEHRADREIERVQDRYER